MKDEHAAQQALKELTAAICSRRDAADKRADWYFRHAQQLDNERRAQGKRKTKRQAEYERHHAAAVSMCIELEALARKADELTESATI